MGGDSGCVCPIKIKIMCFKANFREGREFLGMADGWMYGGCKRYTETFAIRSSCLLPSVLQTGVSRLLMVLSEGEIVLVTDLRIRILMIILERVSFEIFRES